MKVSFRDVAELHPHGLPANREKVLFVLSLSALFWEQEEKFGRHLSALEVEQLKSEIRRILAQKGFSKALAHNYAKDADYCRYFLLECTNAYRGPTPQDSNERVFSRFMSDHLSKLGATSLTSLRKLASEQLSLGLALNQAP